MSMIQHYQALDALVWQRWRFRMSVDSLIYFVSTFPMFISSVSYNACKKPAPGPDPPICLHNLRLTIYIHTQKLRKLVRCLIS